MGDRRILIITTIYIYNCFFTAPHPHTQLWPGHDFFNHFVDLCSLSSLHSSFACYIHLLHHVLMEKAIFEGPKLSSAAFSHPPVSLMGGFFGKNEFPLVVQMDQGSTFISESKNPVSQFAAVEQVAETTLR